VKFNLLCKFIKVLLESLEERGRFWRRGLFWEGKIREKNLSFLFGRMIL